MPRPLQLRTVAEESQSLAPKPWVLLLSPWAPVDGGSYAQGFQDLTSLSSSETLEKQMPNENF